VIFYLWLKSVSAKTFSFLNQSMGQLMRLPYKKDLINFIARPIKKGMARVPYLFFFNIKGQMTTLFFFILKGGRCDLKKNIANNVLFIGFVPGDHRVVRKSGLRVFI
jgi:hypothetical protein